LGKDWYPIKDMHLPEVVKEVMSMSVGDTLRIDGIGVMKLGQVFYQPHRDVDLIVKEIGLICSRLDA
jgi:hypothetical protein